jgi:hypothetical protein
MYTVDQAMPGLSRSSIVLLDDPSAAVPPGAVSAQCYIEFHEDDDVNQRRRNLEASTTGVPDDDFLSN